MKVTDRIAGTVFRPVELYAAAALTYLAVGLALTVLVTAPERRYGSGRLDRTCAARSPAL